MSTVNAPDDVRTRLLETAGEIFGEKGFRATTVRDICSAAGANIASVNYYFGDKQGLYVAAVKHAHACRFSDPPPSWPEGTPPEQKLFDFVRGMLWSLLDPSRPAWNAKLMMRELAEPTQACKEITEQFIRPMASVLQGILREILPSDTPLVDIQLTGFSVVGQCLFYRVQEPIARELVGADAYTREFTVDRLARHIAGFTLAALGRSVDGICIPASAAEAPL